MQAVKFFFVTYRPLLMIIYLAALGSICICASMFYLKMIPNLLAILTFTSFVFFIYIINRFTDLREDFTNDIKQVVFFTNHKVFFKVGVAVAVLAGAGLAFVNKLNSFHFILISVGILYSYRLIPWYKKNQGFIWFRLKEFPLVKNLCVSLLWGLSIFLIPILFSEIPVNNTFLLTVMIISVFLSTFTNTLFSDIMDVAGDKISKANTLPSLWGVRISYKVLLSMGCIWLVSILGMFTMGLLDIYHLLFFLIVLFYPLAYIISYKRNWLNHTAIGILIEMDLLIIASGMVLLSLVK